MSARAEPTAAAPGAGGPQDPRPAPAGAVVGYDGTESSRAAVDWAASVLPAGAPLLLVWAARPLHAPGTPFVSAGEHVAAARACFDELLLECDEALLARPLETEVSNLDPATALIEAAARHGASAIVVGLDRHARLRSMFGTVATELLRRSPVPVAAIPPGTPSSSA